MAYMIDGKEVDSSTIALDGINRRDYPDFVDAYVDAAWFIDWSILSEGQLNKLTDLMGRNGDLFDRIMGH